MSRLKVLIPVAALLAAVLTAIGSFKGEEGLFTEIGPQLGEWAITLVAIVIASAIVGVIASRAAREGGRPAIPALIFAILGVASIAVFWLGLPSVFAGGAAALGLEANRRGSRGPGMISVVLAGLTVAFAIFIAFTG